MPHFSFARIAAAVFALGACFPALPVSAQNLFVGSNGYIEQFSHSGTDLGVFYKDTSGTHLGHTSGLTFDPLGNLLVISDANYGVVKISPTGTYLGSIDVKTALTDNAVAADAFGNIYTSNAYRHTVEKFSPSGTALGTFASFSPGEIVSTGLTFDKAGNLYVSSSRHDGSTFNYINSIVKYAPDGTNLGVFATPDNQYQAQTLAFDSAGSLFVGQFAGRSGALQQFSATGANLGRFKTNYGIYDPLQFAFDAGGNLFVDDNGSVLEYDHSGNVVAQGRNTYMNLGISASGIAFAPFGSPNSPVPEASTTLSLGALLALGLGYHMICVRRRRGVSAA